jgi:hypothetical protein
LYSPFCWQVFPFLRWRKAQTDAGSGRGIAGSCGPTEKKYARTKRKFEAMVARFDKTAAKQDLTYANIARIGAKELRGRSCGRTVVKSEAIDVKCAATVMKCEAIDATCAETFATFDTTAAMPDETN